MPLGLLSGFYAYGENKEYGKLLQVSLFIGLLYGIIGFIGGILLAGTDGVTAFAIAPAIEVSLIDDLTATLPFGLFIGLLIYGIVETHVGAFGRWYADMAREFKLE